MTSPETTEVQTVLGHHFWRRGNLASYFPPHIVCKNARSLTADNRTTYQIPNKEQLYTGDWFQQERGDCQCVPALILTGGLILGVSISDETVSDLVATAGVVTNPRVGLTFAETGRVLEKHRAKIKMLNVANPANGCPGSTETTVSRYIKTIDRLVGCEHDILMLTQKTDDCGMIEHAIAVVGYKIVGGRANVQIIDPTNGVAHLSLELLIGLVNLHCPVYLLKKVEA